MHNWFSILKSIGSKTSDYLITVVLFSFSIESCEPTAVDKSAQFENHIDIIFGILGLFNNLWANKLVGYELLLRVRLLIMPCFFFFFIFAFELLKYLRNLLTEPDLVQLKFSPDIIRFETISHGHEQCI